MRSVLSFAQTPARATVTIDDKFASFSFSVHQYTKRKGRTRSAAGLKGAGRGEEQENGWTGAGGQAFETKAAPR
jgi:hypothetical protein